MSFNKPLKRSNAGTKRQELYSGIEVTLNGKPAKICGFQLIFGIVANEAESYDWSWETIASIVSRGGKFNSQ